MSAGQRPTHHLSSAADTVLLGAAAKLTAVAPGASSEDHHGLCSVRPARSSRS